MLQRRQLQIGKPMRRQQDGTLSSLCCTWAATTQMNSLTPSISKEKINCSGRHFCRGRVTSASAVMSVLVGRKGAAKGGGDGHQTINAQRVNLMIRSGAHRQRSAPIKFINSDTIPWWTLNCVTCLPLQLSSQVNNKWFPWNVKFLKSFRLVSDLMNLFF